MIAVDQDAIDASRIYDTGSAQIFAKTERSGDAILAVRIAHKAAYVEVSCIAWRAGGPAGAS
jgi:hypothetical protein